MLSHSNTTISVVTVPATLGVQADNAGLFTFQRPRCGCVQNYKDLEPLFDQACSGLNHTVCASIPACTACFRLRLRKCHAKTVSSKHEKCILLSTAVSGPGISSRTVVPGPAGYCSFVMTGTPISSALAGRVLVLRIVLAGACIAGTSRSCMSMMTSAESMARISICQTFPHAMSFSPFWYTKHQITISPEIPDELSPT